MSMKVVQLTSDYEMKPFDCGDTELNGFLLNEAKAFSKNRLANTFLICDGDVIIGYFSLFNDKISKQEVSKAVWRKIKKLFPHSKHFGSYPAVKIGRFAIALQYRNCGMGRKMMVVLQYRLKKEISSSTFRVLTVNAYLEAIPFYERNGFKRLDPEEIAGNTRTMFFDMMQLDF